MTKTDVAIDYFLNGYRCSQAVLGAFADDFNLDLDTAMTISLGFAGGAGTDSYCGSLSAGYLVLAMKFGFPEPGNPEKMRQLIEKNQELCRQFKACHENVNCKDLVGLDVFSEKGSAEFAAKNLKETYCVNLVGKTVQILEQIMETAPLELEKVK
ncbi:MAG: C_GCAxxG_C_C family protein [Desulfobacteraceae bacterium]|nr:C_GCAxxG_C_C family protein [Desulfobacteraceae bacterium]